MWKLTPFVVKLCAGLKSSFQGTVVRKLQMLMLVGSFLVSAGLSGCPGFGDEVGPVSDVPELPEWNRDVSPLMERYCTECHGVPATQGAPGFFRLDECENVDGLSGAKALAQRNSVRTADIKTMPPASFTFQPSEIERQIFRQWYITGAPCTGAGKLPDGQTNNQTNNQTTPTNNQTTSTTNNMTTITGAPFTAVAGILANGCGLSSCHATGNGGFTITTNSTVEEARTALAGKVATSGIPFVVPSNPEGSRIFQTMSSNRVGERMPPTGNLPEAQIDAVRTWILSGAPYQ